MALSVLLVPAFLTLGGGLLLAKGFERNHRAVGLVAVPLGLAMAAALLLATT